MMTSKQVSEMCETNLTCPLVRQNIVDPPSEAQNNLHPITHVYTVFLLKSVFQSVAKIISSHKTDSTNCCIALQVSIHSSDTTVLLILSLRILAHTIQMTLPYSIMVVMAHTLLLLHVILVIVCNKAFCHQMACPLVSLPCCRSSFSLLSDTPYGMQYLSISLSSSKVIKFPANTQMQAYNGLLDP